MPETAPIKPTDRLKNIILAQLFDDPHLREQVLADRKCGLHTESSDDGKTFVEIRIGEEKFRKSY